MNAPWKPLALTPAMVRLIGSIDEFKGRWSTLRALPPGLLTQIRQDTVVEAAAATSRLEGRPIDVESLRSQLNDGGHLDASCRSSALAVAYGRTLQVVHELHMELEPTLHHILELQRLLYAQTGLSNPGFSDEQAAQLEHILSDLRGDLEEPSQHPLISIPLFNLRLLSLRPSSAGDGRLARIVTSLLMLRAGYGAVACAPLETAIETHRVRVHRALRRAQTTGALNDWMLTSLQCLSDQRMAAARRLDAARRRRRPTCPSPVMAAG